MSVLDTQRDLLFAAIEQYSDHPSAFISYNDDVECFTVAGIPGAVAYRTRGRSVFQFAAPFTAPQHRTELSEAFREWTRARRLKLGVVQLRGEDAADYVERGFTVDQFGSSYSIDLSAFTLKGKPLAKVRQNISRAERDGVSVSQVLGTGSQVAELDEIDREWLRAKGWHVKKMTFLVGQRDGRGGPHRRMFTAILDGRVVAYISYSPAYGSRPGWLYDLTRRLPQAPVGTIELLNHLALRVFREEGAGWLHLGLTPFAGVSSAHVVPGGSTRLMSGLVQLLAEHGAAVYPAASQERFKRKWAPHVVEPEYLAFDGRQRPTQVWHLLRMTNSI
ncbi:DUF2156 domain-containing protein [Nocardia sp. NPDC006630]|uniref:bifunctional lysylphosphatidylglycerol flippase/synthetase MprF n=1 Tax=Nocardia sp. NPDC006630 TaxID=3157181 RepID=UPI0033ADE423